MKTSTASIVFFLALTCKQLNVVNAATCGGGSRGDGICPQSGLCCSKWGHCGSGPEYCSGPQPTPAPVQPTTPASGPQPTPAPVQPTTPAPVLPTVPVPSADNSRMIAYVGNWHSCPTAEQLAQYTHIVVAFAVSYTWAPSKNSCSATCEIATPPICSNNANPGLLHELKAQGKKIIVSFGGAGMGGSWAGDQNDCWEFCFGREAQVVDRLTEIVDELDADGIDIDYEYFYEDNQNGSGFTKGAEAQNFLTQVTVGLRNSLPSDAIVTHAPMDVDLESHTAYFQLLKDISHTLDFIMPQYYNGVTRPVLDDIGGSGVGSVSALSHFTTIANEFFGGDATRIIFGFCINDCSGTSSNANGDQAAQVMIDLSDSYSCHGGAFFWVANDDSTGSWSSRVNQAIASSTTCTSAPNETPVPSKVPTTNAPATGAPTTESPTTAPPTTSLPSKAPTASAPTEAPITAFPTTQVPTNTPTTTAPGPAGPCCPPGYSGILAFNECMKYFHCQGGSVLASPMDCAPGLLFDNNLQVCNWALQVTCLGDVICV